jgi:hypothetical protein
MEREPQHRLMTELQRTLDNMSGELSRVELLTAVLAGLSRPVPAYEPRFHHLGPQDLTEHELGNDPSQRPDGPRQDRAV